MRLFGRGKRAEVGSDGSQWDVDYRRADDEENVIRINQRPPAGFPVRLFEFVAVAGVSYREKDVEAFIGGSRRGVSLRREFVNEAHPDALAVWGLWMEGKRERAALLGYVPREVNDAIGGRPVAATLVAMYRPVKGKGVGLRVDLWGTRGKK